MLEEKRSGDEKHWSKIRMCAVRQSGKRRRGKNVSMWVQDGTWVLKRIQEGSEDYFFSAAEHALAAKFEFWELHRHTAQLAYTVANTVYCISKLVPGSVVHREII